MCSVRVTSITRIASSSTTPLHLLHYPLVLLFHSPNHPSKTVHFIAPLQYHLIIIWYQTCFCCNAISSRFISEKLALRCCGLCLVMSKNMSYVQFHDKFLRNIVKGQIIWTAAQRQQYIFIAKGRHSCVWHAVYVNKTWPQQSKRIKEWKLREEI